jgi:hypothetical protein
MVSDGAHLQVGPPGWLEAVGVEIVSIEVQQPDD